jgi:hypothetical protein
MITTEKILEISAYLSKIHHVKGRIRMRVHPKIKEQAQNISLSDIESLPQKIKGIKAIKINKAIGSITVTYDNAVFSYDLWEDLLAGKNTQAIATIVNSLAKEAV